MSVGNRRRTAKTRTVELSPEMQAALRLWRSVPTRSNVRADPWASAISLEQLLSVGLTQCDLRWLVIKGYVRHAREITESGNTERRFQPGRNLAFANETRFLLTDVGTSLAGKQDALRARTETTVAEDRERHVLQIPNRANRPSRRRKAA
jgi:hypothetical protein